MKVLLELVIGVILIFFIWNILKRIFFNYFYKYTGFKPFQEPAAKPQKKESGIEKKIHWDAETVDYEEVKEDSRKK